MTSTPPRLAQPYVAAGVLFRDDADRILLVRPTYKKSWDIPGGYVEPGESPLAAARREVLEELGVELPAGRLLVVDWAPHPSEGDKILFVFDGGRLTAGQLDSIQVDGEEVDRAAFHDKSELESLVTDRLTRRLTAALDAAIGGVTLYTEHGYV